MSRHTTGKSYSAVDEIGHVHDCDVVSKDGGTYVKVRAMGAYEPKHERLLRLELQAKENGLPPLVIWHNDGSFTCPSALTLPDGSHPGLHRIEPLDEYYICDCDWNLYHPGDCCVHLGAVFAHLRLIVADPYVHQQAQAHASSLFHNLRDQVVNGLVYSITIINHFHPVKGD